MLEALPSFFGEAFRWVLEVPPTEAPCIPGIHQGRKKYPEEEISQKQNYTKPDSYSEQKL